MKKKKKKKPFDLDGAKSADEKEDATKENDGAVDFDENLDLETAGKKKKKKKKPFNLDDLENNLPSGDGDDKKDDAVNDGAGEDGANIENFDLDLDFSKTKKKKKKKKELDELVAEKSEEQQQILSENGKRFYVP